MVFVQAAIPPRVTEEADRMMRKLRDLQAQVDERSSDVVRKESQMNMLEAEKDAAVKRLRDAEGTCLEYFSCLIPVMQYFSQAIFLVSGRGLRWGSYWVWHQELFFGLQWGKAAAGQRNIIANSKFLPS